MLVLWPLESRSGSCFCIGLLPILTNCPRRLLKLKHGAETWAAGAGHAQLGRRRRRRRRRINRMHARGHD